MAADKTPTQGERIEALEKRLAEMEKTFEETPIATGAALVASLPADTGQKG